jgi:hypothetical protein
VALNPKDKWLWNGRVNSIYARAEVIKPQPPEMLASEAMKTLRAGGLSYSDCNEVMRASKYGDLARRTGFPLCAMPFGTTEAAPPAPKKHSFWKPSI